MRHSTLRTDDVTVDITQVMVQLCHPAGKTVNTQPAYRINISKMCPYLSSVHSCSAPRSPSQTISQKWV